MKVEVFDSVLMNICSASLDLPPMDDSEAQKSPTSLNTSYSSTSSTSIDDFRAHVAMVMGSHTSLDFQDLLSAGCTKKDASSALSRILCKYYHRL